jgi:NAD(P)-dependent dehydrogenase (short-subunit alcohol dehydrogenase family)
MEKTFAQRSLFDINGKIIVVTGATGILAGEVARYLQAQGAHVVYLGRNREKLDKLLAETRQISPHCSGYVTDVLDQPGLNRAYDEIMKNLGRVDVLINGAGGNLPGAVVTPEQSVTDLKIEDYGAVLDLNLKGTVLPTLTFARAFQAQRAGCVINFSSMAAERALTRVLGYSNAKAAVDNFTRWMATELALKYGERIRVCAVAPGFFLTPQNQKLLTREDGSYSERGAKVVAKTPFGRFGKPDELNGTIHYLVSDAAAFVTGVVIPVDGGFSAFAGV